MERKWFTIVGVVVLLILGAVGYFTFPRPLGSSSDDALSRADAAGRTEFDESGKIAHNRRDVPKFSTAPVSVKVLLTGVGESGRVLLQFANLAENIDVALVLERSDEKDMRRGEIKLKPGRYTLDISGGRSLAPAWVDVGEAGHKLSTGEFYEKDEEVHLHLATTQTFRIVTSDPADEPVPGRIFFLNFVEGAAPLKEVDTPGHCTVRQLPLENLRIRFVPDNPDRRETTAIVAAPRNPSVARQLTMISPWVHSLTIYFRGSRTAPVDDEKAYRVITAQADKPTHPVALFDIKNGENLDTGKLIRFGVIVLSAHADGWTGPTRELDLSKVRGEVSVTLDLPEIKSEPRRIFIEDIEGNPVSSVTFEVTVQGPINDTFQLVSDAQGVIELPPINYDSPTQLLVLRIVAPWQMEQHSIRNPQDGSHIAVTKDESPVRVELTLSKKYARRPQTRVHLLLWVPLSCPDADWQLARYLNAKVKSQHPTGETSMKLRDPFGAAQFEDAGLVRVVLVVGPFQVASWGWRDYVAVNESNRLEVEFAPTFKTYEVEWTPAAKTDAEGAWVAPGYADVAHLTWLVNTGGNNSPSYRDGRYLAMSSDMKLRFYGNVDTLSVMGGDGNWSVYRVRLEGRKCVLKETLYSSEATLATFTRGAGNDVDGVVITSSFYARYGAEEVSAMVWDSNARHHLWKDGDVQIKGPVGLPVLAIPMSSNGAWSGDADDIVRRVIRLKSNAMNLIVN